MGADVFGLGVPGVEQDDDAKLVVLEPVAEAAVGVAGADDPGGAEQVDGGATSLAVRLDDPVEQVYARLAGVKLTHGVDASVEKLDVAELLLALGT
ncbi:hypothetical protein [Salinicola acroporae]|uniref:hypothetical protein n=1 Tax=Salinicola acroporae TaxID=1541440 RepID=UPI00245498A4|nr:hypothetical protein [Salinicola acroporae]